MMVESYRHLRQVYDSLGAGDVVIGRIPRSSTKSALLLDLTSRGVRLLPSAMAQMLNDAKTCQALVLGQWMVPHTRVIDRRKTLLDALADYHRQGIDTAVTKQEHQHCGHGVRRWNDLEMLYSVMSLDERHYPFVLQPFVPIVTDLRLIVVGDFREAYARENPAGFRQNLAAGGSSRPYPLDDTINDLCDRIMARGQLPYAHLDLVIAEDGCRYLSEVSLGGGLHGARIDKQRLDRMKQAHLMALAETPSPF